MATAAAASPLSPLLNSVSGASRLPAVASTYAQARAQPTTVPMPPTRMRGRAADPTHLPAGSPRARLMATSRRRNRKYRKDARSRQANSTTPKMSTLPRAAPVMASAEVLKLSQPVS